MARTVITDPSRRRTANVPSHEPPRAMAAAISASVSGLSAMGVMSLAKRPRRSTDSQPYRVLA